MTSPTWPFQEGRPEQDASLARDPVANAEWGRMCDSLASRRLLSPAWAGMLAVAATAFSDLLRVATVMTAHGRSKQLAAVHADVLSQYRAACQELMVAPHPSATLSSMKGGTHDRPTAEASFP